MDELEKIPGCLKNATPAVIARIKEIITDESKDAKYYAMLARREYYRPSASLFRKLAEDERRHAKNFSAALYVLTKAPYTPEFTDPVIPGYREALIERIAAEKRDFAKYARYAEQTRDPCLRTLYLEAHKDEGMHAEELAKVLEHLK